MVESNSAHHLFRKTPPAERHGHAFCDRTTYPRRTDMTRLCGAAVCRSTIVPCRMASAMLRNHWSETEILRQTGWRLELVQRNMEQRPCFGNMIPPSWKPRSSLSPIIAMARHLSGSVLLPNQQNGLRERLDSDSTTSFWDNR